MQEWIDALLQRLVEAPASLLYLVLALAAALENLVPPIPADLIVLFGGFLAGQGAASLWTVFLVVWSANVAGALVVYGLGRRYGPDFFASRWGRRLLRPAQVAALGSFYRRYGVVVIFFSRFIPVFRAVSPAFAGVVRLPAWQAGVPIALASALWYGAVAYLGAIAGANWGMILAALGRLGRWLYLLTLLLGAAALWWWWRSRSSRPDA